VGINQRLGKGLSELADYDDASAKPSFFESNATLPGLICCSGDHHGTGSTPDECRIDGLSFSWNYR